MNEKTVLAIDPGSSKCGMALVTRNDRGQIQLVWRMIAEASHVNEAMRDAGEVRPFELVIVGSGTRSSQIIKRIRDETVGIPVLMVDEKNTTLEARERYWVNTKRHGWRLLLPATLQVPPEPVDDFAALILAERVLAAS